MDRMIRTMEVLEILDISYRTFRRYIKAGMFPPADKQEKGMRPQWKASTVEAWMEGSCHGRKEPEQNVKS